MTTIEQARDQLIGAFRTAWLANPTSAAVPLEYDDVRADTSAVPSAATRRAPFVRIDVLPLAGEAETQGQIGLRRFLTTCSLVVQVFTEPGDGHKKADQLSAIAVGIMRSIRNPAGVWGLGDAFPARIGITGGMMQTNVAGSFQYQEVA